MNLRVPFRLLAMVVLLTLGILPRPSFGDSDSPLCRPAFPDTVMRRIGITPRELITDDIDMDGNLDFITVNSSSSDVSVMRGSSTGVFGPDERYPIGDYAGQFAIGDLDGDGFKDIIIPLFESAHVGVLWGQSDGTLSSRASFPTQTGPRGVALADLDLDGRLDIVLTADLTFALTVIWGDSTRTLSDRSEYPASFRPWFAAIGDTDGDGLPDIATTTCENGIVHVFPNNGSRVLGAPIERIAIPGIRLCRAVFGDLNGDRYADLVALSNMVGGSGAVGLGASDGSLLLKPLSFPGSFPGQCVVADVNNDGLNDLATANYDSYDATVLLGNGDGTFEHLATLPAAGCAGGVGLGDFDHDSAVDAVVLSTCGNTLTIYTNRGVVTTGTVRFSPSAFQRGSTEPLAAQVAGLPPRAWEPEDVSLLWQGTLVGHARRITDADRPLGNQTFYFDGDLLATIPLGDHMLTVVGCDSVGAGFRGESLVRVVRKRSQTYWQVSRPGILPISIQLSGLTPSSVAYSVYDSLGRRLYSARASPSPAGVITWNARGYAGNPSPSGIYLLRLDGSSFGCKVIVLR